MEKSNMNTVLIVIIIAVIAAVGGAWWYQNYGMPQEEDTSGLQINVETAQPQQ